RPPDVWWPVARRGQRRRKFSRPTYCADLASPRYLLPSLSCRKVPTARPRTASSVLRQVALKIRTMPLTSPVGEIFSAIGAVPQSSRLCVPEPEPLLTLSRNVTMLPSPRVVILPP